ncbi:MAG TPA: hypothetical protein VEU30_13425 [Thermoanaerobaculia bacterium]|nr:hypothetical protein [Thermoanaerobaculia bacterium]
MKNSLAPALAVVLALGCAAEKTAESTAPAATATTATTLTQPPAATSTENHTPGTWAGQLRVSDPVSVLNYVGAESGDFVPFRFRNDSEAGKKILAACREDDTCEFTGAVEFLDEAPPDGASAVGQIVRVDSVKKL